MPEVGHKINPLSPEYKDMLEDNISSGNPQVVFGQTVLQLRAWGLEGPFLKRALKVERDRLSTYRRKMLAVKDTSTSEVYKQALVRFFETGKRANPNNEGGFNRAMEALNTDQELLDFVPPELIDDRALTAAIELHNKEFTEKSSSLREALPSLKDEFKNKLKEFLRNNHIDLPEGVVDERVDTVNVELADAITTEFKDIVGDFSPHKGIRITEQALSEEEPGMDTLKIILAHELTHAVSGRTVIYRPNEEGYTEFSYIDHQRIGLRFPNAVFTWLNEAITEYIARDLYYPTTSRAYNQYLDLFLALRRGGNISYTEFFNAYFENYNPSKRLGRRVPHWKRLWRTINNSFEKGFMTKLDRAVRTRDVKLINELFAQARTGR